MVDTFRNMFAIPELRRKLAVTFGLLVIYRIGFHVPLPGVDPEKLAALLQQYGSGPLGRLFGVGDVVSGGAMLNCVVFSLGIMPYISSSIIFQLLSKVVPAFEKIAKEGQAGQRRINQWARMATVPLCLVQGYIVLTTVARAQGSPVNDPGFAFYATGTLLLTAGGVFLMWLGELISEHGIGNGISLIIMAGIIARMPQALFYLVQPQQIHPAMSLTVVALFVLIVAAVVLITQGQRRIPMQQAKQTRGRRVIGGQRTYIPLRVNFAGVMPIVFASSLLIVPQVLFSTVFERGSVWEGLFQPGTFLYTLSYIVLIFFFCFFWTSIMFQPKEWADQLKEYGSFVQGIRPGKPTAQYLEKIMLRITLAGGAFLALIAVIPQVAYQAMGLDWLFAGFLGGTGMLIVVGVCLDFVQKVESHLLMRHYEGFLRGGGRIRGRTGR